jgi:hypothetical protein
MGGHFMTLYEALISWLIINEVYVIWRFEIYLHQVKQKLGSNRANGLPSV